VGRQECFRLGDQGFEPIRLRARGRARCNLRARCLKHLKDRPNARVVSLKSVLVDAPLLPQLDRLFPGLERRRLDAFLDVVEDRLLVVLQAADQAVDLVDLTGSGFQQCGVLDHWHLGKEKTGHRGPVS
jgi:hypothetical protein